MLILGLLLLACTAAFTGLALADNLSGGPDYNVTVLGHHIATMNSLAIFCAGLALALIFGLGCMLAMTGGALRRRKSRKLTAARRDAAATARERDALAARLEDTRAAGSAMDEPGYATSTGDPDTNPTGDTGDTGAGPVEKTPPRRHHARHLFGH
jgi:type IV secretory pathway VirB6-like protein